MRRHEAVMDTRTKIPSDHRDLLAGSATIGTMLLVSASAKIGYGVWALGIAALTCVLYRAGKYVAGRVTSFFRRPSARPFWRLREDSDSRGLAAMSPPASMVPEHGS